MIVGRPERKTLVANFGTTSVASSGNVWVRTGFSAPADDVVLPDGTAVVASPNESDPPRGDWRTIDRADGRGAPWPLVVQKVRPHSQRPTEIDRQAGVWCSQWIDGNRGAC